VKARIVCEACGETILEGKRLRYWNGVEDKDDGIGGAFFYGAGECKACGRRLCGNCGNFDKDCVCASCREKQGGEGAAVL
jgi:hypothetical protein